MKNRITQTLAITLAALGLAGLPALASADGGRHSGDLFKSQPRHSEHRGDRHQDRQRSEHRGDQHRDHGRHGGYGKHHRKGHHHGRPHHKHNHGHHYGHGSKYGYYKQHHNRYYGHGSHISLSGFYVAPPLGIAVVIH
jgi:hypothetical protein